MPFFSDYAHTTFETLSHVFELVLLYAPLGFVWRRLGPPPGSALAWSLAVTLADRLRQSSIYRAGSSADTLT